MVFCCCRPNRCCSRCIQGPSWSDWDYGRNFRRNGPNSSASIHPSLFELHQKSANDGHGCATARIAARCHVPMVWRQSGAAAIRIRSLIGPLRLVLGGVRIRELPEPTTSTCAGCCGSGGGRQAADNSHEVRGCSTTLAGARRPNLSHRRNGGDWGLCSRIRKSTRQMPLICYRSESPTEGNWQPSG